MTSKAWRPENEEPGVGMNADGTLNVVTPAQYKARVMQRNADEAVEAEADILEENEQPVPGEPVESEEA